MLYVGYLCFKLKGVKKENRKKKKKKNLFVLEGGKEMIFFKINILKL